MKHTKANNLMAMLEMALARVAIARERSQQCRCTGGIPECHHMQSHRTALAQLKTTKAAIKKALHSKACPECGRKGETK